MTSPGSFSCPSCRAELQPDANYCTACGLEVRPACPECARSRRPVATAERGNSPWCPVCGALLFACQRCGRWLRPDAQRCPDPRCLGEVLPAFPQFTGRRWDGSGATAGWKWPARWDPAHPERAPVYGQWWTATQEVYAAFVAHGRLFLWEEGALVAPVAPELWTDRDRAVVPGGAEWRSPLGPNATPVPGLRFEERVAIAGSRAVLAVPAGFVQAHLRHPGEPVPVQAGMPLAQVGGPGWWAGWTRTAEGPVLGYAAVGTEGTLLAPERPQLPPEARLARGGRLVLRSGRIYWPGEDSGIWGLDPAKGTVRVAARNVPGAVGVWAERDGPRVARESAGQITVTLSPPDAEGETRSVPAGAAPLRQVCAASRWVVVAGERISAFAVRTGERLHDAVRPPGRWIHAVLATADDEEPRLVTLTREGSLASLTAVRLASGIHDLLWREDGIEPLGLLAAEGTLDVVHSRGVVRFVGPE